MARFYGTIQGQRGEATRLGHSSLNASAQSYSGDVDVRLYGVGEVDYACIRVTDHGDSCKGLTLYDGPISALRDKTQREAALIGMGLEDFLNRFDNKDAA